MQLNGLLDLILKESRWEAQEYSVCPSLAYFGSDRFSTVIQDSIDNLIPIESKGAGKFCKELENTFHNPSAGALFTVSQLVDDYLIISLSSFDSASRREDCLASPHHQEIYFCQLSEMKILFRDGLSIR